MNTLHWILAWMHLNYQEAYWESVAMNQWWMKLLMELTDDDE